MYEILQQTRVQVKQTAAGIQKTDNRVFELKAILPQGWPDVYDFVLSFYPSHKHRYKYQPSLRLTLSFFYISVNGIYLVFSYIMSSTALFRLHDLPSVS